MIAEINRIRQMSDQERMNQQHEREQLLQKQRELEGHIAQVLSMQPAGQDNNQLRGALADLERTRRQMEEEESRRIQRTEELLALRNREEQNMKNQNDKNLNDYRMQLEMQKQKELAEMEQRKREQEALMNRLN